MQLTRTENNAAALILFILDNELPEIQNDLEPCCLSDLQPKINAHQSVEIADIDQF